VCRRDTRAQRRPAQPVRSRGCWRHVGLCCDRPVAMPAVGDQWLSAAACYAGPGMRSRLTELPREYRRDIVRFGAMAAATSLSFVIAAVVLAQPLPSRSFAHLTRPPVAHPRSLMPVTNPTESARAARRTGATRNAASPLRTRFVGPRTPMGSTVVVAAEPVESPVKRHNAFSRFFRGAAQKLRLGSDPRPVSSS
jgi:hypothetical protein